MQKGLFIMNGYLFEKVYTQAVQKEISEYVDIIGAPLTKDKCLEHPDLLDQVDVIW